MNTKLIMLILFLGFLNNIQGQAITEQENKTAQELYDFHIDKKKANNTAAWICLGGGIAMIVSGTIINLTENIFDDSNEGIGLVYVGGAATFASIPLFISGKKHKRKAEIQLKTGTVTLDNRFIHSGVSIVFSF